MNRPAWSFFALLAAAASAAPASAAVYRVGPPGTAGGCTHTEVQAAIDAAAANPGADEIRLVRNTAPGYTQQALVIDGQDLTLTGGLADCAALTINGRTWLSGEGGIAAPVIAIRSSMGSRHLQVHLEGLGLQGGDNDGGYGGGLSIHAGGEFVLANSDILGNSAPTGAGIGIIGAEGDSNTHVTLGDNVTVSGNAYSESPRIGIGGGISVEGADLSICGRDTRIVGNSANDAGGIWVTGISPSWPARLELCAANAPNSPVLENNSAHHGGGLQVRHNATVRIYTRDADRPLRIANNRADYGGAIEVLGATARVDLWEVHITGNIGNREGGAFWLYDGAQIGVHPASNADAPPDAVSCASHRCNTLADNRSDGVQGVGGAVAALIALPSAAAPQLHIDNALITSNRGTRLFSAVRPIPGTAAPARISLRNSVIAANPEASSWVQVTGGSEFLCDLCTVAYNGPASTGGAPLITSDGPVHLSRSIIWDPGRDLFTGTRASLSAQSLLVHDDSDLAGQADIRVGDPRFIDDAGNFHLRPDSPALDSAAADDVPAFDLDGNPRVRDLTDIPDRLGAVDLGAYERRDNDSLFRDGFE